MPRPSRPSCSEAPPSAALAAILLTGSVLLAGGGTLAAQEPPDAARVAALAGAADQAWREGETERAERLYAEILAADSTHYAALHRMALIRAWADRHDESLRLFDRLLGLYPEATDARVDRARVLAWQGHFDRAIAALEAVLDGEPAHTAALSALGQAQAWAGRYDDALRSYSRLERLDAGGSAPYDRARVLAWASRFEAAAAVYDSILAERPRDTEALAGKAQALMWAGRAHEAAAAYEALLDVDPGNVDALHGLARGAAWSGDLRLAERRYRELVATATDNIDAVIGLARTLRWQGRDAEALDLARRAIALDPTSGDARDELRAARLPFSPFGAPALVHESDSDGNRIMTASLTGRYRPGRVAVRVDGYARSAGEVGATALDHHALGGTVTAATQLGVGWGLSGTVGASTSDEAPRPVPAFAVSASSPGREPVRGTITLRRQAFDATARLILARVEMTEIASDVHARLGERSDMNASAGVAWLIGRVSEESNRRWSGYLAASHRPAPRFTVGATARGFGYARDLDDGYFDPDFFGLAELLGRWQGRVGPVELRLEAAPGLQKVRAAGDVRPVGRVAGGATWSLGIGRELALGALLANAGLDRLSAAEGADYRYLALSARLGWTF